MSFLFGKPETPPPPPRPTPPAPRIGDAAQEASVRAESSRLKKRRGVEDTILTGLGSGGAQAATETRTLLGGGTR